VTTVFSQFDPDVLVMGSRVLVAWTDESSATTGADIKFRTFDTLLIPTSGEQVLAGTVAAESEVALTTFEGGWAASWKESDAGLETLHTRTGTKEWTVGPYLSGPSPSRPAVVELDSTHLLCVFLVARDAVDGGTPTYALHGAILDLTGSDTPTDFEIPSTESSDAGVPLNDMREIDATRVGGRVFLAWRTKGAPGDASGDDVWLKSVAWTGGALDLSAPEIPLPRWAAHTPGDQRRPVIASTPLAPAGALATAWDDLGSTLPKPEAFQDVVEELVPTPIVRLATDGGF
jgi:hypothetical protein